MPSLALWRDTARQELCLIEVEDEEEGAHAVLVPMSGLLRAGIVGIDFGDFRTVLGGHCRGICAHAAASGSQRAVVAARNCSEQLKSRFDCASDKARVAIAIRGNLTVTLHEIHDAALIIQDGVSDEANIIFSAVFDDRMSGLAVTVLAVKQE